MRARTCLIIENEHYLSESISSKLEGIGFNTRILSSTKDAMELDSNFSLILLSLNLQNEDMFFLTIKKFKNSIIIMMTSHIDNSCLLKATKYGADDFILKPFIMEALIHKISIFQKMRELEDREQKATNFLSHILENRDEFDLDVRLPLLIRAKLKKQIDSFVFFYSQNLNKQIEISSYKHLKNLKKGMDIVYYLRDFSELSEKDKNLCLIKSENRDIIIGSTTDDKLDMKFNSMEISLKETIPEIGEILTVSDYIKNVILQNQNKMPDTELSKYLGISRKSLWEKRRKFDIQKVKKT